MSFGTLWPPTVAACVAALAAAWVCRRVAALPRPWWLVGYFTPLLVVVVYAVGNRRPDWALSPWFAWSLWGVWRKVLLAAGVGGLMGALTLKLPRARERRALVALAAVVVAQSAIWPAVSAAGERHLLSLLPNRIDRNGVCRQNTDYTCGPASAVTALLTLGVPAEEGELAILAGSSAASGTPPDVLEQVLNGRFGPDGVHAELRRFHKTDELDHASPTLALLSYAVGMDHWVCVFRTNRAFVLLGDPMGGLIWMPRAEFESRWRRVGIAIQRAAFQSGRTAAGG